MGNCDFEGCTETLNLPYNCKYCGKKFCGKHRLPENHKCSYLEKRNQLPFEYAQQNYPLNVPDRPSGTWTGGPLYQGNYDPNQYRGFRSRSRSRNSSFSTMGTWMVTKYIMVGIPILWLGSLFIPLGYLGLNIQTSIMGFFVHTLFTSMFLVRSLWSLLFIELSLYFIARPLEISSGSKYLLRTYFISGGIITGFMLALQLLGYLVPTFSVLWSPFAYLISTQAIITTLIIFSLIRMGLEREFTFLFYFVPIRLKGKWIIVLFLGFDLISFFMNLVSNSPFVVESAGVLFGFIVGYIMARKM